MFFRVLVAAAAVAGLGLVVIAEDSGDWCDALKHPDVKQISLRMPRTKIPLLEFWYMCLNFELPHDQDYHLIGFEVYFDKPKAVHHLTLNHRGDKDAPVLKRPVPCDIGKTGTKDLSHMIAGWSHGLPKRRCHTPKAGFLFGKSPGNNGKVELEMHWSNHERLDDFWDSSGLILYYTPKLRPFNLGLILISQQHIRVPPGQLESDIRSECTPKCTSSIMKGPIQVASISPHMHAIGVRQVTRLKRPGEDPIIMKAAIQPHDVIDPRLISNYTNYDPAYHTKVDPPITVRPGDQVTMTCEYETLFRNVTTGFGFGGDGEHCLVGLAFYPAENMVPGRQCYMYDDIDLCGIDMLCQRDDMLNSSSPELKPIVDKVLSDCNGATKPDDKNAKCPPQCLRAVQAARADNGCVREQWQFMPHYWAKWSARDVRLRAFRAAVDACVPAAITHDVPQAVLDRIT